MKQVFVKAHPNARRARAIDVTCDASEGDVIRRALMLDGDVSCYALMRAANGSRATTSGRAAAARLEDGETYAVYRISDDGDGRRRMRVGLFGGGGDGGATGAESRSAYLEMYAWNGGTTFSRKKESLGGFVRYSTQSTVRDRDEAEEDLARWFTCALTEEPLESGENGVVIDRTGALYNKEPVLKALRDKALDGIALPKRIEHITGMKALVTCKFTKRRSGAAANASSDGQGADASVNARDFRCGNAKAVFACPITDLDFNGKTKFVVMRPSGVVVADKALREARDAVEEMNDGLKLADAPPPIPVNPRGEELELLKSILDEEAAKKESKKKKKDKKSTTGGDADATTSGNDDTASKRKAASTDKEPSKKFKAVAPAGADAAIYASLFTSSRPEDDRDQDFLSRNARKAW